MPVGGDNAPILCLSKANKHEEEKEEDLNRFFLLSQHCCAGLAITMKLFAVSLCWFVLVTCQITFGQSLFPSCERSDLDQGQCMTCDVTGKWINELGSCMNINVKGNHVSGMYWDNATHQYMGNIFGWISDHPNATIAFSVLWKKVNNTKSVGNSDTASCTAWVGQCFPTSGGSRILKTLWLLRTFAKSSEDNWSETRVGADDFTYKGVGKCH